MDLKVRGLKVRNYTFTGYTTLNEVETEVEGEFSVWFDGRYPSIQVECITSTNTLTEVDLMDAVDLQSLEEKILETDTGEWYTDMLAEKADYVEYLRGDR